MSTTNLLNNHLSQKLANRQWVQSCLGGDHDQFPYQIKEGGKATIQQFDRLYDPDVSPKGTKGGLPVYLVNIPCAFQSILRKPTLLKKLLRLFETESLGTTSHHSKQFAENRLAVVIGVNRPLSIDPSRNREFEEKFDEIDLVSTVSFKILGFNWKPVWECNSDADHLLKRKKAFLLLKALSGKTALTVLEKLEGSTKISGALMSQIPFQQIRDRIRSSPSSIAFAAHFERTAAKSPMYFGTMDADTLSLQRERRLFSSLDQAVKVHQVPSIIGCGYDVKDDERPIIRLGILLDMVVREAMTRILACSAYMPEPSTFFCIREAGKRNILLKLSFIGPGRTLENRRLIENARGKKLLKGDVVFLPTAGVVMGTPSRMKTQKNGKVTEMTPDVLKQKQYLKALRDVSQTHATPKQWADNLYLALGFSVPHVTDLTQHLMHIFGVYDPISRALGTTEHFTKQRLGQVLESFDAPLTATQKKIIADAKKALKDLGLPQAKISLVITAAQESGKAIFNVLTQELANN